MPRIWVGVQHNMSCAKLGCIRASKFLAHKGVSAHITGETSPKNSRKWPNKPKGQQNWRGCLKGKQFSKLLKRPRFFKMVDPVNSEQFLVCRIRPVTGKKYMLSSTCLVQICPCAGIFGVHSSQMDNGAENFGTHLAQMDD